MNVAYESRRLHRHGPAHCHRLRCDRVVCRKSMCGLCLSTCGGVVQESNEHSPLVGELWVAYPMAADNCRGPL